MTDKTPKRVPVDAIRTEPGAQELVRSEKNEAVPGLAQGPNWRRGGRAVPRRLAALPRCGEGPSQGAKFV
jgi:hypothetical protein